MTPDLIIADSMIWIDHLNKGDEALVTLIRRRRIRIHPMIIAEVALGSITKRGLLLQELKEFPAAPVASHIEVMAMIEWLELWSRGIGYVDAHLLASTRHVAGCALWTRDKRLQAQAERLGVAYVP
jgi:predicted nucleic acid-binding protein